jgi:hypothetical protein
MPYRHRYAARRNAVTNDNSGGWSQPVSPQAYPPQGGAGQFGPPPGYPPYPPSPGYYVQPKPPTKSRWPWIVGGIVAAVVLVMAVGAAVVFTVAKDAQPQAVEVIYEVTGPPGAVEVTYWGSDDNRSGPETVTLPWRTQVTMRGEDMYTSLSVERAKASDESVTCRITADGKVIQENQSISRSVSCHGRVGEK